MSGLLVLAAIGSCDERPRGAGSAAPASNQPVVAKATYLGGASCVRCHEQQTRLWLGSHHDLAMQVASDSTVLGDFRDAQHTYFGVTSTFYRDGARFMVRTDGADGQLHDDEVVYTYGVYPLQQYLIRFPDGRMQALNVCWDARPAEQGGQRWFHLYPDENVRHDDILHWTGPYQNWNHMCAECHSTSVRKGYDAANDRFATTWREVSVSCEACHGPGSGHVAWAQRRSSSPGAQDDAKMGLVVRLKEDPRPALVLDPARGVLTRDRPRTDHAEIETCARCHSRRGTFDEDYTPGRPISQTHRLALLESELYEADGQIKDEVYEYGSFLQSKMYAAGVTCTDCHDPHSLKTPGGNLTCAKCHVPSVFDNPSHHKHAPGSPAAQCVSCHAPTRNYMVVHARHDHSFRVPRPDLTVKIGTPNACNGCHADQTARWAADAAAQWWGPARAAMPHYGEALDAGRHGKVGAPVRLIGLLEDQTQPAIVRASAVELLEGAGGPAVAGAMGRALKDSDSFVRAAAVRAWRSIEMQDSSQLVPLAAPLLRDQIRQVRMDAAVTLADVPDEVLGARHAAALRLALDEYRESEMCNADRAESRLNLGVLALRLGDADAAEKEYLAALRLSPRFGAAYVNLADLYRAQGREREAEATLRQGLKGDPQASALHHALGLALVRQRRMEEAVEALVRARDLAPQSARYAYVLAVALESAGKRSEAIELLIRTHDSRPGDAEVLAALAGLCRDAGRIQEAIAYARRLAELRPWDADAAAFLADLRGAGPGAPGAGE